MNSFDTIFMEADISDLKLNHIWESAYDSFNIHVAEIFNSPVVEESIKEIMYAESVSDLAKKVGEAIQKIIDTIVELCSKLKKAVAEKLFSKKTEDTLNDIKESLKQNPQAAKTQVEISDDEKRKEMLNKYIQEMAKLERRLLVLKVRDTDVSKLVNVASTGSSKLNTTSIAFEAAKIAQEMEKLNEQYDKGVLEANEKIIKMALGDAIRFNEKQLNNIKVDYDAIEKNAKTVLKEFKKDAEGCDVPVKYNIIQKMCNSIGYRVREELNKKTKIAHINLKTIIGAAAAFMVIKKAAKNPEIRKGVRNVAQKTAVGKKILDVYDDPMVQAYKKVMGPIISDKLK